MRRYTNKRSFPCVSTVWKQGRAESSSGHYGSRNALCRWVNIWECRKCDTMQRADILIKAKGCFGPLSSAENFILGAKYQCQDIRGLSKSDIMFCNIACKQHSVCVCVCRIKNCDWCCQFKSLDNCFKNVVPLFFKEKSVDAPQWYQDKVLFQSHTLTWKRSIGKFRILAKVNEGY